ncbi:MAG: hypothetical protein IKV97_05920, partial [Clostridia bacterium]|nr:hypothetical protein [Clostridia bacterium]
NTYNPGDTYVLNMNTDAVLYAQYATPTEVVFTANGETSTELWMEGKTYNLPAAPATAPDGQVFAGWQLDGTDTVYAAGDSFAFTGEASFTAKYATPGVKYLSATGAIDGVTDPVYTSFDEADNAIAAEGGIGTIYVDGNFAWSSGGMTIDSKDLTILGYDNEAKLWINANDPTCAPCVGGYLKMISNVGSTITVDDIIVRRADTYTDEAFIGLQNIHLIFGENCGYEAGKRCKSSTDFTLTSTVIDLYVSQYYGANAGYSITNNSPDLKFAWITPTGAWGGGNVTHTGDFNVEFNAGWTGDAFLATRNGNGNGANDKINGDSTFVMNGGTIAKKFAFSSYPATLNGNATAIFNGGSVSNIVFGDDMTWNKGGAQSTVTGTVTYVINAADMDAAPTVKAGKGFGTVGTSILVYNNVELADVAVEDAVTGDYIVLVTEGVATPVEGQNGKFSITPDNDFFDQVLANGVVVEADANGYYTLPEGKTSVTFGKEGAATYTLSYTDNGVETAIGEFYNNTNATLPVLTAPAGFAHDGYSYNGTVYAPGASFTMPAEDVVLEVIWYENAENVWYVKSNGNNKNGGHKAEAPLATIPEAFVRIGAADGKVVLMDMVNLGVWNPTIAADQTITITGEGYEGAGFANGKHRMIVSSGHLVLEHLIDYNNESVDANTPFIVGSAELTIGEGYKLAVLKNGAMTVTATGTQIEFNNNITNPVVNADGDIQFITIIDWGNRTINGDLTINIGPNATYGGSNQGIVNFGGDASSNGNTATVKGQIYVNVDGNQSGAKIFRNGFKAGSNTVINGYQILLKDTNVTFAGDHSTHGTYTNTGAEYVVTATTMDGCDVVTTSFGKVMLTVGPEAVASITDANGTREVAESGEITLAEGATSISFGSNARVTIVDSEGNVLGEQAAGTIYTIPAGTAAEDELFFGWTIDGTLYAVGSSYTLPAVTTTVVLTPFTVSKDAHVYIDAVNGNDANTVLTAETAVQTLNAAAAILAQFPEKATLHVVGELYAGALALPAYNGVLTVVGTDTAGVLSADYDITLKSDIVLKDIGLKMAQDWKHIYSQGFNITVEEGTYKVAGSMPLRIHAGKQGADTNGDMTITLNSTAFDNLHLGPFYINDGQTKNFNGDITVNVGEGVTLNSITGGDGYGTVRGKFAVNGAVTVNVAAGATITGSVSLGYITSATEGFVIYNYGTKRIHFETALENDYCFNFYEGVTGTFADGVLTTNKAACLANTGADTNADNKINVPQGTYDVRAGKSVKDEGLTVEGAQIRTEGVQALRFVADYTDALKAQYADCEYGFVVIPTAVLGNNMLVAGGSYEFDGNNYDAYTVKAARLYSDEDGYVTYTAALTGLEVDQYKTEYTAVTYIKSGDEYIYGDSYTASVYKVAQAVLADETVTDEAVRATMQALIDAADAE